MRARAMYNHIITTGIFGIAEKIKEFKKNPNKRNNKKRRK